MSKTIVRIAIGQDFISLHLTEKFQNDSGLNNLELYFPS